MPTDEQTLQVKAILENIKAEIDAKRASGSTTTTTEATPNVSVTTPVQPSTNNGGFGVDDAIPF